MREHTYVSDYSRPIARNATAPGGFSISSNVENVCLMQPETESITVTHIFKKRVKFDTRESCSSGIVFCVSRVTDRLHLLGFRRFWECLSSRGPSAAYAPGRRYQIDR